MREIRLNGYIDDEVWFGDEITPAALHDDLYAKDMQPGEDVRIILNSYGGSCNAATQMYDELKSYPGNVHIVISGTAASAATVLAMAANRLEMTPGSLFMCHDPIMAAYGNEADLEQAQNILRACKDSIINMYCARTWHNRDDVAAMMSATTWMDANAALQEGFIDAIMTEPGDGVTNAAFDHVVPVDDAKVKYQAWIDRRRAPHRAQNCAADVPEPPAEPPVEPRISASDLENRLDKLKYTY